METLKRLVLIGGGGHCKSVLDSVVRTRQYKDIVVTDPRLPKGTTLHGNAIVVGSDDELRTLYESGYKYAFITIGSIKDTAARRKAYVAAKKIGFLFPNIVDPSSIVADSAILEDGIFIGKNAVVNADARIGTCAIINTAAIVEHECSIGQFAHISANAIICGNTFIGNDTFIGAGATVIQGLNIGDKVMAGAGSVVRRDVSSGSTVYGMRGGTKGAD